MLYWNEDRTNGFAICGFTTDARSSISVKKQDYECWFWKQINLLCLEDWYNTFLQNMQLNKRFVCVNSNKHDICCWINYSNEYPHVCCFGHYVSTDGLFLLLSEKLSLYDELFKEASSSLYFFNILISTEWLSNIDNAIDHKTKVEEYIMRIIY